MNSDNLSQLLQQGFRVTIGAAASLVETLQDPQKRDQNLAQLQADLSQLTQEWAVKGEVTEQDARTFVDALLKQVENQAAQPSSASTDNAAPPQVQLELQELTAQLSSLRKELEKLRSDSSPS